MNNQHLSKKRATHKYINGYRFHVAADGNHYPGVTTVLGATKDNSFLDNWRDKMEAYGHEQLHYQSMGYLDQVHPAVSKMRHDGIHIADQIRDASAERGNLFHNAIEEYLISGNVPSEQSAGSAYPCFQLVRPLLEQLKDNVHSIEAPIYNTIGYAGSADLIAEYQVTKTKRELAVFDWKNSRKPKKRQYIKDYILQVSAYIHAANQTLGLNIERGYVIVAVQPDSYLELTNPGMVVEPELQIFSVTPNQNIKAYNEFLDRLSQFKYKLDNWF